jgi:hypothetical protein
MSYFPWTNPEPTITFAPHGNATKDYLVTCVLNPVDCEDFIG